MPAATISTLLLYGFVMTAVTGISRCGATNGFQPFGNPTNAADFIQLLYHTVIFLSMEIMHNAFIMKRGFYILDKIISAAECAVCRLCCTFERYEIADTPAINNEMFDLLSREFPKVKFSDYCGKRIFRMNEDNDGCFRCPLLDVNGCRLGCKKPFECQIWPLVVVKINGKLAVTITPVCKTAFSKPLADIMFELNNNNLAHNIFLYAKAYPEIVHIYKKCYPVLAFEDDYR